MRLFARIATGLILLSGSVSVMSNVSGLGTFPGTPTQDVKKTIEHSQAKSLAEREGGVPVTYDVGRVVAPSISFERPMRLAIQQRLGSQINAPMVVKTKQHLAQTFGYANLIVYYLDDQDLSQAIRSKMIDYFIANADFFALEQSLTRVTQIATLWPGTADSAAESFGGVIFSLKAQPKDGRATPELTLMDLSHASVAATFPSSMSGWMAPLAEFARAGGNIEKVRSQVSFLGTNPDNVVNSVLSGMTQVGVLPACYLEQSEAEGKINIERDFNIINRLTGDGLRCVHSTQLYPGWAFAALPHVDAMQSKAVSAALFTMAPEDKGCEWALPTLNRSVFDLFYTLKVGPYSHLANWNLQRFMHENAGMIALGFFLAFLVLSYAATLSMLVHRKTRQLREALAQRDLIEAEATQSRQHIANLERTGIVGQMSTIIAHELKQPLGAIMNYANGLLRRLGRDELNPQQFEDALKEIASQAERASQIVERVRSYARHDYPPRKVADLSVVINHAIQTFRRSRTTDAQIVVKVAPFSWAAVDEWEIELAVLNLLKNATDAISGVVDPCIEVALYAKDDKHWILSVADNGPFITDEALANFFKPLQTSKGDNGMGLGLSIVANIAERHAGHITVERNGTRGVRFLIMIPRVLDAPPDLTPGGTTAQSVPAAQSQLADVLPGLRSLPEKEESNELDSPQSIMTKSLSDVAHLMDHPETWHGSGKSTLGGRSATNKDKNILEETRKL